MTLPANRTGVIAKKVGMTRFFDENGQHVPVTVLSIDGLQVVQDVNRLGALARPDVARDCHRGEQRKDRHDEHDFDEGETEPAA